MAMHITRRRLASAGAAVLSWFAGVQARAQAPVGGGSVPTLPGSDPVAGRGLAILNRYMDEVYPAGQTGAKTVGSSQAYASLTLNRSPAIIADTNVKLAEFLQPFIKERYWISTKESDLRLYWHQTLLIKLLVDDTLRSRLSPDNQASIKALLWNFVTGFATEDTDFGLGSAQPERLRRIHGSDNHDMIRHGFFLFSTQILKDDKDYAARALPDGSSLAGAYARWTTNLKHYLPERASAGLLAEIASPSYVGVYLQTLFVIAQHAADNGVRSAATRFLDLVFADAGQETLHGIRGGARSRAYKNADNYDGQNDRMTLPLFVLTGLPDKGPLWPLRPGYSAPRDCFALLTSSYRLPPVVQALFHDRAALGSFQYDTERPATGTVETVQMNGASLPIYVPDPRSFDVRSTWVTPDYMLGWFTIDEGRPALLVHDQNEMLGAVTSVDMGRLAVTGTPSSPDHLVSYGDFQSVGSKGSVLIRRGLHAQRRDKVRVFLSPDFKLSQDSGYLVALAGDARSWFALRSVRRSDSISEVPLEEADWSAQVPGRRPAGHFYHMDPGAVLAIVSGGVSTGSFDAFVGALRTGQTWVAEGQGLTFTSPTDGMVLTLPDGTDLPAVNHQAVQLPPKTVFSSPWLSSDASRRRFTVKAPRHGTDIIDFDRIT